MGDLSWVKGRVIIQTRGGEPERFLNEALADGLQLTDIKWTSTEQLQMSLPLSDFFRLRPHLKRTGCRMHIVARSGLPFLLALAERRIFFVAGFGIFFAIIILLSSLVWHVDIQGNQVLSDERILAAARKEGVHMLQWSLRLAPSEVIAKRLQEQFPEASWIGVDKNGTKVTIRIVEATIPKVEEKRTPRHLVASADAVVTQIIAETGKPQVRKNMKVKKGQTLISGIIGNEQYSQVVVAKGSVRGLVWHEYEVSVPLTQTTKVYTGAKEERSYLVIGGRSLQWGGERKPVYAQQEVLTELKMLSWKAWSLPFGKIEETIMETRLDERKLSKDEARSLGILQAKAEIMEQVGTDAKFTDEIVLHEQSESGKVYMRILLEVDQSIVMDKPIVQMQGD